MIYYLSGAKQAINLFGLTDRVTVRRNGYSNRSAVAGKANKGVHIEVPAEKNCYERLLFLLLKSIIPQLDQNTINGTSHAAKSE